MFKSMTMMVGGAAGIYLAVAAGAPPPSALMSHLTSASALMSQVTSDTAVHTASCAGGWGTDPKSSHRAEGPSTGRVTDARAGQHACFDRLVIDLGAGAKPGYDVRYVHAVHAQGSGNLVPLRGSAKLEIDVSANAAARFPASARNLANVSGFRTFRQVAGAGSFEGDTEIGAGLQGRRPFRAMVLSGPGRDSRLVIDVAHH
jgi:hypothetical protein